MAAPAPAPQTLDWFRRVSFHMRRAGIRRLLVLSGDDEWSEALAGDLRLQLPGDWLWVGEERGAGTLSSTPSAIRSLLGREFLHAIFDARRGLALDGLAALAGMLTAGSWLVLLTPQWTAWPELADADSLRWSEQPQPIATPNFIEHFQRSLQRAQDVVVLKQQHNASLSSLSSMASRPDWQPPQAGPTSEQQILLDGLLAARAGIYVLTAPRGRGKSALAGMLAARAKGECWVVAPARHASMVLAQYAADRARFFSPDALLEYCRHHAPQACWLLVDEAAAIPTPVLRQLISFFPRVLLTTTVQGYEGTGRGFLLKFCASLPQWHHLTLQHPLRWAAGDPLERWLDDALLLAEDPLERPAAAPSTMPALTWLTQDHWRHSPNELREFYALLSSAHYRTTPLDLRRLLDAAGQYFIAARADDRLIGALWSVDEGGLSPALAHEVWAGRRRPPGNLVAQSLAAHGGIWTAPQLSSRRVSRIAVEAVSRRQGIGRELLVQARRQALAEGCDFMSVSFGLTDDLRRFWQASGFQVVHVGSHLDASSGCYSAMALLPLSVAGHQLAREALAKYRREQTWPEGQGQLTELNADDWRALAGFAFAQRPPEACQCALRRLLFITALPLPALRGWLEQRIDLSLVAANSGLSGKRMLISRWRQETATALSALDERACRYWQAWSGPAGYLLEALPDDPAV
jgi:tRNA(Met) cytidine acetyltransferase